MPKGHFEMTGKQSMRIFPEGADIVNVKAGSDGSPQVEFIVTKKTEEPPALSKKKPGSGVFDPLADDGDDDKEEGE